MGQTINVLMYGCRIPEELDVEELIEKWGQVISPKVEAYELWLRSRSNSSWTIAKHAFVPKSPMPDDARPDALLGFFVCRGDYDSAESHRFPAMTFAEMQRTEPMASVLKRCRRRWSRFQRWARTQGVTLGKARVWRTRTEVA
jgi:hypothetical protein